MIPLQESQFTLQDKVKLAAGALGHHFLSAQDMELLARKEGQGNVPIQLGKGVEVEGFMKIRTGPAIHNLLNISFCIFPFNKFHQRSVSVIISLCSFSNSSSISSKSTPGRES